MISDTCAVRKTGLRSDSFTVKGIKSAVKLAADLSKFL